MTLWNTMNLVGLCVGKVTIYNRNTIRNKNHTLLIYPFGVSFYLKPLCKVVSGAHKVKQSFIVLLFSFTCSSKHLKETMNFLLLCIIVALTVHQSLGFGSGPPVKNQESLCVDMIPQHYAEPQAGEAPYMISTGDTNSYAPGQKVTGKEK